MYGLGEEKLYSRIARRISEGGEFKFLEETANYLGEEITMDVYNYCFDRYSEARRDQFDPVTSKRFALRRTYDYIFYGPYEEEVEYEECEL